MATESLTELMEKFKNDYYSDQGKNSFFKKSQKMECAKEICQKFNVYEMIQRTVYRISNTNRVIFDYTVFKIFANPDNYDLFVSQVINVYDQILSEYDKFEVHIILESFTISAAERYKDVIKLFSARCMSAATKYSSLLTKMCIYYTPVMMDSISSIMRPFIDPDVSKRIVMYSKAESQEKFNALFLQDL